MLNLNQIRSFILQSLAHSGTGHLGGSLGTVEIQAYILENMIRFDPYWFSKSRTLDLNHRLQLATKLRTGRNKYVLSAGHLAPCLYAVLAEMGLFDEFIEFHDLGGTDLEDSRLNYLKQIRDVMSDLEGHPSLVHLPFLVDSSTGPLGQGAGVSVGYALADLRYSPKKLLSASNGEDFKHTFALLGDGECQEGQVWESAMLAAKYALQNLTWIVDRNYIQIDGDTETVGGLDNTMLDLSQGQGLALKFKAFGWVVMENPDGNDYDQIEYYIVKLQEEQKIHGRPGVLINYSQVGYPFKEFNSYKWHGKTPSASESEKALRQLEKFSSDSQSSWF